MNKLLKKIIEKHLDRRIKKAILGKSINFKGIALGEVQNRFNIQQEKIRSEWYRRICEKLITDHKGNKE